MKEYLDKNGIGVEVLAANSVALDTAAFLHKSYDLTSRLVVESGGVVLETSGQEASSLRAAQHFVLGGSNGYESQPKLRDLLERNEATVQSSDLNGADGEPIGLQVVVSSQEYGAATVRLYHGAEVEIDDASVLAFMEDLEGLFGAGGPDDGLLAQMAGLGLNI